MKAPLVGAVLALALLSLACGRVSREEHSRVLHQLEITQSDLARTREEVAGLTSRAEDLDQQVQNLRRRTALAEGRESALSADLAGARQGRAAAQAESQVLRQNLSSLEQRGQALQAQLQSLQDQLPPWLSATCAGENPALKVLPALVHVRVSTPVGPGQGSGFVVQDSQGYVLTAHHVVARANRIELVFRSGERQPATHLASYPEGDLALLGTRPVRYPPLLPPSGLGEILSRAAETKKVPPALQQLVALRALEGGYVSFAGPTHSIEEDLAASPIITFGAPVQPGTSGGPVVNPCGVLVGVTSLGSRSPSRGAHATAVGLDPLNLAWLVGLADALGGAAGQPPPRLTREEVASIVERCLGPSFQQRWAQGYVPVPSYDVRGKEWSVQIRRGRQEYLGPSLTVDDVTGRVLDYRCQG
jgi:S1-C subfamily serine protease